MDISKVNSPRYLELLPQKLHADALVFLRQLESLPKQLPRACPYCDSDNYKVKQKRYCLCKVCGRGFSALTGTPLYRLQGPERFRAFAEGWLAGEHAHEVGARLGMDGTTARTWAKRLLLFMAETHPDLHTWWSSRLYRQALELPPHIDAIAKRFLDWLERLPHEPSTSCPRCDSTRLIRHNHSGRLCAWMCKGCGRLHNRLTGTPLKGLSQMELWRPYAEMLLQGYTHRDCVLQLGLAKSDGGGSDMLWRKRFLRLIEQQEPELLPWIDWQCGRRKGQLSSELQASLRERRFVTRKQAATAV